MLNYNDIIENQTLYYIKETTGVKKHNPNGIYVLEGRAISKSVGLGSAFEFKPEKIIYEFGFLPYNKKDHQFNPIKSNISLYSRLSVKSLSNYFFSDLEICQRYLVDLVCKFNWRIID